MVDPEGDPRQHDDEHRRQVVLEEEEADVAFQLEAQRQPLITACRRAALQRVTNESTRCLSTVSSRLDMHTHAVST